MPKISRPNASETRTIERQKKRNLSSTIPIFFRKKKKYCNFFHKTTNPVGKPTHQPTNQPFHFAIQDSSRELCGSYASSHKSIIKVSGEMNVFSIEPRTLRLDT